MLLPVRKIGNGVASSYGCCAVNQIMHKHTGTVTTLAVAASKGDYQITVADATGFTVGGLLNISYSSGSVHDTETTFPIITATPGGNVLTLDRMLDRDYPIGTDVELLDANLKGTIGSLASPIIYGIDPPSNEIWQLQRLLLIMTHGTAGDDGKFGDIAALTNGIVIRVVKGATSEYDSITEWKSNSDIKLDMYDLVYTDKAGGPGGFGTAGRMTFTRFGYNIELNGGLNDRLELIVQDDLTSLDSFTVNLQGIVRKT